MNTSFLASSAAGACACRISPKISPATAKPQDLRNGQQVLDMVPIAPLSNHGWYYHCNTDDRQRCVTEGVSAPGAETQVDDPAAILVVVPRTSLL